LREGEAELVGFAKTCALLRGDWIAIDVSKFRGVASIDTVRERLALKRYLDGLEKADQEPQLNIDQSVGPGNSISILHAIEVLILVDSENRLASRILQCGYVHSIPTCLCSRFLSFGEVMELTVARRRSVLRGPYTSANQIQRGLFPTDRNKILVDIAAVLPRITPSTEGVPFEYSTIGSCPELWQVTRLVRQVQGDLWIRRCLAKVCLCNFNGFTQNAATCVG
jgi:hypothetical protein